VPFVKIKKGKTTVIKKTKEREQILVLIFINKRSYVGG
jgi:hypothetical protein